MNIEERGWYIAGSAEDPRWFLRCSRCKKTLIVYTDTTAQIVAAGRKTSGRLTPEGWENTLTCPGCQSSIVILLKDVYDEIPYRGRPNEVTSEQFQLPLATRIKFTVENLVKTAQAFAAADLKSGARPNRGWRLEPEFWRWFVERINPLSSPPFFSSVDYALSEWLRHCDESPTPVMYRNVDAPRLLRYVQVAITDAKYAGSDPLVTETNYFDPWLLTADKAE